MPDSPESQPEIYPMPAFPTLKVRDIEASARWYTEVLGFTTIFTMPGPGGIPSLVHLRWIKYADLLLFPERESSQVPEAKGIGVALNFSVEDVDQLAERARRHNARIVEGPVDRPWNIRELVILDPDGYRLVFNGRIQTGNLRSFAEIIESAAQGFEE